MEICWTNNQRAKQLTKERPGSLQDQSNHREGLLGLGRRPDDWQQTSSNASIFDRTLCFDVMAAQMIAGRQLRGKRLVLSLVPRDSDAIVARPSFLQIRKQENLRTSVFPTVNGDSKTAATLCQTVMSLPAM